MLQFELRFLPQNLPPHLVKYGVQTTEEGVVIRAFDSMILSNPSFSSRVSWVGFLRLAREILSVLLATTGAILSIKSFENSFYNNHQRIGLGLYGAIWVQAVAGFLRPHRGNKRRSTWYFVHWILGTVISLVGIINIYTGFSAYRRKMSRSTRLLAILFTAQVSFMAFVYLFQDRWEHMQQQGVILGGNIEAPITPTASNQQNDQNQKVLVPERCGKRNSLRNLFD